MSEINYVPHRSPVAADGARRLNQQERSFQNERFKEAREGKSEVNVHYHQSSNRPRQQRSVSTSVQKRNIESRARELKRYMVEIVNKDRGISSDVYRSFNMQVNDLLVEVAKWTDSNDKQQSQKVEDMLYAMQQMPWEPNYQESQKSDPASRNSYLGVAERLSDMRAVRHISYVSPPLTGEQMMANGKKKLQHEITHIINQLSDYILNNPSMGNRDKNCILLEIEKLKESINTISQSSSPGQFRSRLDGLRKQVFALQKIQMCSMMRAVDLERKMPVKEIISNYFGALIDQIDKIKFPPIVEKRTRVIITGDQKVLTTLLLDDGSSMKSEWIIPGATEEIPLV